MVFLLGLGFSGCWRGEPSTRPPIHPNANMDSQEKFKSQSLNSFFEDSASMRTPVAGTVAQGWLKDDPVFYTGIDPQTKHAILKSPVAITMTGLQRGRQRYNIYCSPCHSRVGDGKGIMIERGYVPPPNFHSDLIRSYPDGHIFDVITHGIRNMPAYNQQIPVQDRWLIINYLRALQRSQFATRTDIPDDISKTLK